MEIRIRGGTHTHTHTYTHTHTHTQTHTHIHTYIHTHTRTHTQANSGKRFDWTCHKFAFNCDKREARLARACVRESNLRETHLVRAKKGPPSLKRGRERSSEKQRVPEVRLYLEYVYIYIYVYIYMYMYIYTNIYMYMYVCIY